MESVASEVAVHDEATLRLEHLDVCRASGCYGEREPLSGRSQLSIKSRVHDASTVLHNICAAAA